MNEQQNRQPTSLSDVLSVLSIVITVLVATMGARAGLVIGAFIAGAVFGGWAMYRVLTASPGQ